MKRRVEVSDHALLRHIERVLGYDVEAVRDSIRAQTRSAVESGAVAVRVGGFTYRIVDDVVVSVVPSSSPDIRTGRAKKGHRRG